MLYFTIEDSLKKGTQMIMPKQLLGGDLEIDYNRNQGNIDLVNKVERVCNCFSEMIEFSTMLSTTNLAKKKINHYLLELKL